MIKVVMDANGIKMTYEIDTMETLAKFQAQLTEEVVKSIKPEISDEEKSKIFDEMLEECENDFSARGDFVEKIENDMPRVMEELEEMMCRDTDFGSVEELADAYENRQSALREIYDIAREWS